MDSDLINNDEYRFISHRKSLIDALVQLNNLRGVPLVLFVINDDNKLVGTLTDGDSRSAGC